MCCDILYVIFIPPQNFYSKSKNLPKIRTNTSFFNLYFYCINLLCDINDLGADSPYPPFCSLIKLDFSNKPVSQLCRDAVVKNKSKAPN